MERREEEGKNGGRRKGEHEGEGQWQKW